MKALNVEVVTPAGRVFAGEAIAVQLPGSEGSFQVLYNHAPIISTLGKGTVTVRIAKGEEKIFNIEGGVAEVANNQISVLANSASEA